MTRRDDEARRGSSEERTTKQQNKKNKKNKNSASVVSSLLHHRIAPMSSRALKRLAQAQQLDGHNADDHSDSDEEPAVVAPPKKAFNPFALVCASLRARHAPRSAAHSRRALRTQLEDDNDNDNDNDTPEEDTPASSSTAGGAGGARAPSNVGKRRKAKPRGGGGGGGKGRSKATKADDDALLDSLVLARSAESATQQQTSLRAAPLLQVEAKHLDYAVELKRIFGSSIVRGASSRSLSRSPLLTA